MFFKKAAKKSFDHDSYNERFQKLIFDGYLASALQLANEADSATIDSPQHSFWIINKAQVYLMSGDYLKMKMAAELANYFANQSNDPGAMKTKILIAELMILFPLSYEDLESKIATLAQLNPNSTTLNLAHITLSGREVGKPFHEMLKMYICSQINDSMTISQKSLMACQWGFLACHPQDLELDMEAYREAVKVFCELQHEAAHNARMKLIANGKHDPEEYLMILRQAILTINLYSRQYSYDKEMVDLRDEMFHYYAICGDPRSADDLVIQFDLLNQPLQLCRSCGMPLIKDSQICWNCGSII